MIDLNKKFFFQEISSTHRIIKENKFEFGSWILANHQTDGIGQHNRIWKQVGKQNIYFSAKVSIHKPFFSIQLLPILVSAALLKAIQKTFTEEKVFWKWINDLYKNNKKIAGILIETSVFQNKILLILSFGLNLAGKKAAEDLKNKVGFLFKESIEEDVKEEFIINIIQSINLLFSFDKKESIYQEIQFLNQYNYLKNKKLSFVWNKNKIIAFFNKIDLEKGELYLQDQNLKIYRFFQSPEDFTIYH